MDTQSQVVLDFYKCTAKEILISGPRSCCKSVSLWLRTLALHEKHPNFQSAIIRSELKSIADTVIPQLLNKVFKYHHDSRRNPFTLVGGPNRPKHIDFINGGRMTFGGMDDPGKVLGGEYDLIVYNQAERERRESAWTSLIGCIVAGRGGNWVVDGRPFSQIIGDANPNAPTHWLYLRFKNFRKENANDKRAMFDFTHKDHPGLFRDGVWQPQGIQVTEELESAFKGHDLLRMVHGHWVAAQGLVYKMFSYEKHVKPVRRDSIPSDWKWFMAIDYGSNNPSVCQLWATDPNHQRHIMFREAYISGHHIQKFLPYIDMVRNGGIG